MLTVARVRAPRARLALGVAEALPYGDGEFDFVFSVDVIHHVRDRAASFAEAFRVLRPGGRLCVATDDEATLGGRLHRRYFPETLEVELRRYPQIEALRAYATDAGFAGLTEERTSSPFRIDDAAPYRERAFSSLHLISAEAYRRGLAQLERDLEAGPIDGADRHVLLWSAKG